MKTTLLSLSLLALLGACSKWQSNQKQITNISTDGTWVVSSYIDDGDDDDNLDDLDFNINFNVSNKLDDLSDDWDIISYSDTEIKLIDVSGGNGGTDYLTLTKQ